MKLPSTIDATGKDEAGEPFKAWLRTIGDGSAVHPQVIDLAENGKYRAENLFDALSKRKGFTVNANGAQIFATTPGDRGRAHCRIWGAQDIIINDLHTEGVKPVGDGYITQFEAQHGFDVADSKSVALNRCSSSNVRGDFVYLGGGNPGVRDFEIRGFVGRQAGRSGMAPCCVQGADIQGLDITNVGRSMFDIEPLVSSNVVSDFVVQGGVSGIHRLLFVACVGAASAMVKGVHFRDHATSHGSMSVLVAGGINASGERTRQDFEFARCTSDVQIGNGEMGAMEFRNVQKVRVVDNRQPCGVRRNMRMAKFTDCVDYLASGNTGANMVGQAIVGR